MTTARSVEAPVARNPPNPTSDLVPLSEERAVITRLRQGDRAAFATLYGWYGEMLFRQAILPRLPILELAEDCLRDTFRTAMEKLDQFQQGDLSVFFWLRRIAINKAIDVHRRLKRDGLLAEAVRVHPEPLTASPPSPLREIEVQETQRDVDLSLSMLAPRYAEALRMRLIEDRPREECAEALGVTVGNFDVILHRAAKAFRKVYPP